MTAMIEAKGADYVARWADHIRARAGATIQSVAHAIGQELGIDSGTLYQPGTLVVETDKLNAVVGTMTPAQAKAVVARVRAAQPKNPCHYCGLETRNGKCEECV